MLADFAEPDVVDATLTRVERGNLALFGYGIKGFALSAVETAAQLAGPHLHAVLVEQILDLARGMLSAPVELLPGAQEAVWALREAGHRLVLVTKGDLLDQERKLEKSGLAGAFDHVEIISEKNTTKYAELLRVLGCPPERFLMVGNSVRSDILPVVELGGRAVHVPYHLVWEHEHVGSWAGHDNVRGDRGAERAAGAARRGVRGTARVSDLRTTVLHWIADDPDPRTRQELSRLVATQDWDEVEDRFAGRLQFGTAGLRGALGAGPNRMNRATVTRAAAGLAAYLTAHGGGRIVIGFDARHDSDMFAFDTAEVMRGAGIEAYLFPRPVPTPVLAYAILRLGCAAGVMVTASHNPAADNGYKVYLGEGSQIVPPADQEISAAMDAVGRLADVPRGTGWTVLGEDVVNAYIAAVAGQTLTSARDLRVAYTPLHGVGRDVLLAAFSARRVRPARRRCRAVRARPGLPDGAVPQPRGARGDGPRGGARGNH